MSKKDPTKDHRKYVENFLERVQKKRSRNYTDGDIERILEEMKSSDETVRARAVREICPCQMPGDVFLRLRSAAKQLQHDPDPAVRAEALHIEEDARMVAGFESQLERMLERDEVASEKGTLRRSGRRTVNFGRQVP